MQELHIDIEKLNDRPVTVDFDIAPDALGLNEETDLRFEAPVTGQVMFARVGDDVVGNGRLRTEVIGACSRCLGEAGAAIDAKVDEQWLKEDLPEFNPNDDDHDVEPVLVHQLEGDQIQLRDIFRELLLAEVPPRMVCSEDCKGLCPGCGANLNVEPCQCPTESGSTADEDEKLPDWKRKLKNLKMDR